tara:strand:+ start:555 stop:2291 length:1737 start_codon:yes stop_codon:yes gene_type:complete
MPKISQTTIDQIRDRADIVDIISQEVNLKRKGINYFGVCPFHDEKTPSFSVSPSKQIYHCFGCGNGGNVFTFLMEYEKVTFFEAVKGLAEKYNIIIEEIKNTVPSNEFSLLYDFHERASIIYENNLFSKSGSNALTYLTNRKLKENIIKEFRIGFALNSWNSLYKVFINDKYKDSMMKSGLFSRTQKGVFDRFRSRIMFPIFHQSGKIIAFGGRAFESDDMAKYLNSPETTIYQKSNILYGLHKTRDSIRKAGYAVLVEGYMDFLQLYQAGIKTVVAISGTSLTMNHAKALSRLTNKIILLYDGDSAGGSATIRAGFIIYKAGMESYVIRPPEGMDPDDWILNNGKIEIEGQIENPVNFIDYHIDFHNADKLKGVDKRDYLKDILSNINSIEDVIIKNEFVKDLSEKLNIDEVDLLDIINKINNPSSKNKNDNNENEISFNSNTDIAELEILSVLINSNIENRKEIINQLSIDLFNNTFIRKIIKIIFSNNISNISELMDSLTDKKERTLLSKLLIDEKNKEITEQIVIDCIRTLKSVPIKREIKNLRAIIKQKELEGHDSIKELKEIVFLQNKLKSN